MVLVVQSCLRPLFVAVSLSAETTECAGAAPSCGRCFFRHGGWCPARTLVDGFPSFSRRHLCDVPHVHEHPFRLRPSWPQQSHLLDRARGAGGSVPEAEAITSVGDAEADSLRRARASAGTLAVHDVGSS
eukprot:8384475-Pyramimonas_sp.AAC.1